MPFGNGTGPAGLGPMTGRAAGFCSGFPTPGYMNPVGARGFFPAAGMPIAGPYGYGVPYSVPSAGWGNAWIRRGFGRGIGRGRGGGRSRGRGRFGY